MSARRAFTIIELLVVIAIITLLISLLLPSLSAARDQARFTRWLGYSHGLRVHTDMVGYWNFQFQGEEDTFIINQAAGNPFDQARDDIEPQMFDAHFKIGTGGTDLPKWSTGRWESKGALEFMLNFADAEYHEVMNPSEKFTFFAWGNLYSGASCWCSPVTSRHEFGPPYNSQSGYKLYANPGLTHWEFWTGNGVNGWPQISGSAPKTDRWTFLAATFDSTTGTNGWKRLYIDGVEEAAAEQAYGPNRYAPIRIGAGRTEWPDGAYFWDGLIDEVGVLKTALDAAKIDEMTRIGKVREVK